MKMEWISNGDIHMSEIIFPAGNGQWAMKITKDKGILFNREAYPNTEPDEFARAVIDILERCFSVTFEKRTPPKE
jgi:hypothetical protein